ncbi:MAG: SufD family Fe-S cluster assembly protein [Bacteroidales bacterium]|jgi:Fe-S cluster assembly protein SufD|nr:SufD family Fe-S cluster assembly protein [Bacteroidales bacterium]
MNGLPIDALLPPAHPLKAGGNEPPYTRNDGIRLGMADNGFMLCTPEKTKAAQPVRIIRTSDHNACNNIITMEAESCADVLLVYPRLSGKISGNNDLTEIHLKENAVLNLIFLQDTESIPRLQTKTVVRQASGSRMTVHYATLSGEYVRNELHVNLDGSHAEHQAYGLAFTEGSEYAGYEVQITHTSPECRSNQLFKQILSGTSTGSFSGKVTVNRNAQKTAAYQRSSNILLDLKAKMTILPHLEIYADDVKCSHGATVGQLNNEALFYLRSRGIGKIEAKKILLLSFLEETIKNIKYQYIKDKITQKLIQKMEKNH